MAKVTQLDKNFFRISQMLRQADPEQNWTKFHQETKLFMVRFLRERTSLSWNEIFDMFGMAPSSRLSSGGSYAKWIEEVDKEKYYEFANQMSDLLL